MRFQALLRAWDRTAESGRRAAFVSTALTGVLAGLTLLRFGYLVGSLEPADYGIYNLAAVLITLCPIVATLGLSTQFQRIAHDPGFNASRAILAVGLVTSCGASTFIAVGSSLMFLPFVSSSEAMIIGLSVSIASLAGAGSMYCSQLTLGRNRRAASAAILFVSNLSPTLAIVPAALVGMSVVSLLVGWATINIATTALAILTIWWGAGRTESSWSKAAKEVSWREGLLNMPSQAGVWAFAFLVRYYLGLNLGASSVAAFAVASTVVDTAFLISSSILLYFSNDVMTRRRPVRHSLCFSGAFFLGAVTLGAVIAVVFLPLVGKGSMLVGPGVFLVLILGGFARLDISAVRPLALGLRATHVASLGFVVVTGIAWIFVATLGWGMSFFAFASVSSLGFILVSIVQRYGVHIASRTSGLGLAVKS